MKINAKCFIAIARYYLHALVILINTGYQLTTCLGMLVSYFRVKFFLGRAILEKSLFNGGYRLQVIAIAYTHTHVPHNIDKTFYKLPVATLVHLSIYAVK